MENVEKKGSQSLINQGNILTKTNVVEILHTLVAIPYKSGKYSYPFTPSEKQIALAEVAIPYKSGKYSYKK